MLNQVNKKIALGAAIGLVAGYVTGILTAPKSGKETRQDIKEAGSQALKETERRLKKMYGDLDEMIDKAKSKLNEMSGSSKQKMEEIIAEAQDAKIKAKEVLSAFRAGEASDPDLQAAVNQASEAKKHLLDYIKR